MDWGCQAVKQDGVWTVWVQSPVSSTIYIATSKSLSMAIEIAHGEMLDEVIYIEGEIAPVQSLEIH